MFDELASCPKVVGVKQSMRALREGRAKKVYFACDADPQLLKKVEELCAEYQVDTVHGATMAELGSAGGIAIGAAVVTALKA